MSTFEKGARVRVRNSSIDSFLIAIRKRIEGRTGVVRGHVWGDPNRILVTFPKQGRKSEYEAPQISARDLELAEDDAVLLRCSHCGKMESVSREAMKNGDSPWVETWTAGNLGLCGGSEGCTP
ncbi:hypothetical protein ACODYM_28900 [Burkholderia gladioli]|uniref:hypothetical protein n=1 Tax=Burkholderia gladioli TaxID=28095 RepID=UPI003B50D0AA